VNGFVRHYFDRATFSVDRFLPFVNLRVADKWEPNGSRSGRLLSFLIRWILVPLLVAPLADSTRGR